MSDYLPHWFAVTPCKGRMVFFDDAGQPLTAFQRKGYVGPRAFPPQTLEIAKADGFDVTLIAPQGCDHADALRWVAAAFNRAANYLEGKI